MSALLFFRIRYRLCLTHIRIIGFGNRCYYRNSFFYCRIIQCSRLSRFFPLFQHIFGSYSEIIYFLFLILDTCNFKAWCVCRLHLRERLLLIFFRRLRFLCFTNRWQILSRRRFPDILVHHKARQLFLIKICIVYYITISRIKLIDNIIEIINGMRPVTQKSDNTAVFLIQRIVRYSKEHLSVLLKRMVCGDKASASVVAAYHDSTL